jgi:hypothetical protein
MSDTKNVKLGVCQVFFGGVDLGYTQGGVEVSVTSETHKVYVDQFGKTVVNEIILSRNVEVKCPLAETTVDNLARIMPGASITATGGTAATGTITFSGVAVAADTVTVNGVVFTAAASPTGPNQFGIGTDASSQAAILAAVLRAYEDPKVATAYYVAALGVVNITFDQTGILGNAFTLAKSGTSATVSAATLSGGVDPTHKKVTVTTGINTSLLDIAKLLVLHPKGKLATDKSEDFNVPLAATAGAMQFAYQVDKERIFNTVFMGYPDPTTDTLFVVGDISAT